MTTHADSPGFPLRSDKLGILGLSAVGFLCGATCARYHVCSILGLYQLDSSSAHHSTKSSVTIKISPNTGREQITPNLTGITTVIKMCRPCLHPSQVATGRCSEWLQQEDAWCLAHYAHQGAGAEQKFLLSAALFIVLYLVDEPASLHILSSRLIRKYCKQAATWGHEGVGEGFEIQWSKLPKGSLLQVFLFLPPVWLKQKLIILLSINFLIEWAETQFCDILMATDRASQWNTPRKETRWLAKSSNQEALSEFPSHTCVS